MRCAARGAVAVAVAAFLALGCAGPLSDWSLRRAQKHLDAGRPERTLGITERALERHRERPVPRELELHVEALEALGRRVEARAFEDYARRLLAGELPTADVEDDDPTRRECMGGQEGAEMVTEWGQRPPRGRELGVVAARFEIRTDGRIGAIRVLRASDPGAAWWLIETVRGAKISSSRLLRHSQASGERFPFPLCAWFELGSPESREVTIPEGGCIRGFCTHTPGGAPHM